VMAIAMMQMKLESARNDFIRDVACLYREEWIVKK
jgi:hypothetical protein